MERWLPITGYEGRYEVSDRGRVRALFRVERQKSPLRIIGSRINPNGRMPYWQVTLVSSTGDRRQALIHQLVLEAFVGSAPAGTECRHLDGDSDNNSLANLAWGTRAENLADRELHGRLPRGEAHGAAKLTADAVREIRRLADVETQRAIAARFGISPATVGRIVRRINWAHVP